MADEPGSERLEQLEEEEGGPVKSFLEHLEDLRWVLIKSLATIGVAMLVCFFGGNHVFKVLRMPLLKAPLDKFKKGPTVRVMLGTNQLGIFHAGTNDALTSLAGTNQHVLLKLVPLSIGTNQVLAVNVENETKPPLQESPIGIVSLGPAAAFVVATKIAFYGGLIMASPFVFYFVAQFVFPALRMREKKYVYG